MWSGGSRATLFIPPLIVVRLIKSLKDVNSYNGATLAPKETVLLTPTFPTSDLT